MTPGPLRRLMRLATPVRGWVLLAALSSFGALAANIALMTAAPYLISKATLVTGFAALALAVTAVRAIAIARAALRYSERYVVHLAALRVLTEIRVGLFRAIEPLAPGGLRAFRSGDLLARTVADVDTLDAFFVRGLVPPVAAGLAVVLACAILAAFEPLLALVLFALLAIGGVAVPLAARRLARRPSERSIAARAELHAGLASDLSGLADLTAFGQEGRLGKDLAGCSRAMDRERQTLSSIRGAGAGAGSILAGAAGLAVLVLAIPGVRDGGIEGVFLASVPLVAFAAYEAVLPLGDAFREVELSRAAAARTFEIVDAPAPVPEPAESLAPLAHPRLELRHVRFRYDDRSPDVLDDVSLTLGPGDRLGLTGPSGTGKTTIVGLLLRFWDAMSGEVLLDGVDVQRFRADDVRALIGVVPQQVYLFNGSLRDNLLVADGDADDMRILHACERAGLQAFLRSLPRGLGTLVGDDGLKLSGGERQRVAIARAFLKDAPILILDEATANLDPTTESEVVEQVGLFARGKTLLVISHRPAALELADRVMTLGIAGRGVREPEALR
ncbi:MAG TPA: thiol reductant ABC exporter subunit CydC [Actinomycetota bacterium]